MDLVVPVITAAVNLSCVYKHQLNLCMCKLTLMMDLIKKQTGIALKFRFPLIKLTTGTLFKQGFHAVSHPAVHAGVSRPNIYDGNDSFPLFFICTWLDIFCVSISRLKLIIETTVVAFLMFTTSHGRLK